MPKSFKRKAFDYWSSRNRGCFRHPPVIVENRKKYFIMRFRGINSAIECIITTYDYSISVSHGGQFWDFIESDYLSEQWTPSGQYICRECKKLFPTRFALWEDHIFKPILYWSNNNLLKTKWVCIFKDGQGATMAQVVDENSLLIVMQDDSLVKAIPLMPIQTPDNMGSIDSEAAMRHIIAFKKFTNSLKKLEPD
jgi:hypothetical protein